jgi:hypothetical protein
MTLSEDKSLGRDRMRADQPNDSVRVANEVGQLGIAKDRLEQAAKKHSDAVAFGYVAGKWMPGA